MRHKLIFFNTLILLGATVARADKKQLTKVYRDSFSESSPFTWVVSIIQDGVQKVLSKPSEMTVLLLSPVVAAENKKANVKCGFDFNKDTSTGMPLPYGTRYEEFLSLTCLIGNTEIQPGVVGCSQPLGRIDETDLGRSDGTRIVFEGGGGKLEIWIHCGMKM